MKPSESVAAFSRRYSIFPMPLKTHTTPGSEAAKRRPHRAGESSGRTARRISRASPRRPAARPPANGSITSTATPRCAAVPASFAASGFHVNSIALSISMQTSNMPG